MHGQMTSAFYPTPEKTEVTMHFPPPPLCNPLKRARFLVAEFQDERTERGFGGENAVVTWTCGDFDVSSLIHNACNILDSQ